MRKATLLIFFLCTTFLQSFSQRITQSLDGIWEIEQSLGENDFPTTYHHSIQVPGIVSMETPAFDSTGIRCSKRNYYWYHRTFKIGKTIPEVVILKLNKAKYGTKVYVNGIDAGYNPWCMTPSYFNIRKFLHKTDSVNDLTIRIGATEFNVPDSIPNDRTDLESSKHFAGIYDDVKLILTNYPYINNIQIIPDIVHKQVKIVAEILCKKNDGDFHLNYSVCERGSGKVISKGKSPQFQVTDTAVNKLAFVVPMKDCKLWSPESPFLYKLTLSTGKDSKTERFGMRTFSFDPKSGHAILNGKPYSMLGTNVCIFRFFEDHDRGKRPWDKEWVLKLFNKFKFMNWNSIRFSIGFPPEIWYEVADETGFLIQDEYPYWHQRGVHSVSLEIEYQRWMRERWNHPCVVIWDAQNETNTNISSAAIRKVRGLDLSNRPWDNGFAPPQAATDCIESHPYLFIDYSNGKKPSERGYLVDLFDTIRLPDNDPNQYMPPKVGRYHNAVVINEYGWLWLNRDGSPTTLTDKVYDTLLGKNATPEQRFLFRAKNVAILTEYWRCHRQCAALMYFCGLGYSRSSSPRGQTSDIFIDIPSLTIDPYLVKYVKPKFAPLCLMIDKWNNEYHKEEHVTVPVFAINDLSKAWLGKLTLEISDKNNVIATQSKEIKINSFGRTIPNFQVVMPNKPGDYQMTAKVDFSGEILVSQRSFSIH